MSDILALVFGVRDRVARLPRDRWCVSALAVLTRCLPFHRRFTELCEEWARTTPYIEEALDLLWRESEESTTAPSPLPTRWTDLAFTLKSVAPVDDDGIMLPIEGVRATWLLTLYLAELLEPEEFPNPEDIVMGPWEGLQEIMFEVYCDAGKDDAERRDRYSNHSYTAYPAGRQEQQAIGRQLDWLETSEMTPDLVRRLRADSETEGPVLLGLTEAMRPDG